MVVIEKIMEVDPPKSKFMFINVNKITEITLDLKLKVKVTIYKEITRPVPSLSYKCWAKKAVNEKSLYVTETQLLTWMCGVTRMDLNSNE